MAETSLVTSAEKILLRWNDMVHSATGFVLICDENGCVKSKMLQYYKEYYGHEIIRQAPVELHISNAIEAIGVKYNNWTYNNRQKNIASFNPKDLALTRGAAAGVWNHYGEDFIKANILVPCANQLASTNLSRAKVAKNAGFEMNISAPESNPFDRRLDRLEMSMKDKEHFASIVPFKSAFAELSTSSYLISRSSLDALPEGETKNAAFKKVIEDYEKLAKDQFYKGVPALQNYYALTRLYGSNGGAYLVNQKGQRRWYEVDTDEKNIYNYASTPTTSALISWGRGDPHGRTPYQFTDFVFSKYWNKIQNNRLITLRRYPAPILDNLKFPGMVSSGGAKNSTAKATDIAASGSTKDDGISFPPMATAITYFGGDSGNSLTNLLKFSTGLPWEDVTAAVWEVNTDKVPNNESGAGSIFGGIAKLGEMLNVAGGTYDREMVQNDGVLPPDPYKDGPYENRIMGPINRIDSVKKRKPGLTFEWSGLNLVFEYVARPVGGINPKAVLLDIMSNFLVIGSASAVFFGGAHRFMAAPAKYPFMGGGEGIEKWYKGDPIGWGTTVVNQFTGGGANALGPLAGAFASSIGGFISALFSGAKSDPFAALSGLFSDGNPAGNLVQNYMAKKTAGQVPYLTGMKAILTGEPVGEWHVTIGNPLNPIAMIGNLVCENMTVEFNEELGPDDFPTEMKVTVKLNHAMARDRDAIESMFNRGMGRIYMLPDSMSGSADYQTVVDKNTKEIDPATGKMGRVNVGTAPDRRKSYLYSPGLDNGKISSVEAQGKPDALGGELSVWNRAAFSLGLSENSSQQFISSENNIFQTAYRTANWVALKSI